MHSLKNECWDNILRRVVFELKTTCLFIFIDLKKSLRCFSTMYGVYGGEYPPCPEWAGGKFPGVLEIPHIALEEILVNALIHRDYFISAPIRIFVFTNRSEIISPGHLPNNLTIENIKRRNSNIRNPVLASFAMRILPYRGLGSGITRALKEYPHIDFEDDHDGNIFKVTIARTPGAGGISPGITLGIS
jgi:ATP-dependent DNA helicase RecG